MNDFFQDYSIIKTMRFLWFSCLVMKSEKMLKIACNKIITHSVQLKRLSSSEYREAIL